MANNKATILIVDDSTEILYSLSELLHPTYRTLAATSGKDCLRLAGSQPKPDLILLDVGMPEMDGYETLSQLRKRPNTQDIPVIFVTALNDSDSMEHGLRLGAIDYITKPVAPMMTLTRIGNQIELIRSRNDTKSKNLFLESEIAQRMAENERIQNITINVLATLADQRDHDTGQHIIRTQQYVYLMAVRLQKNPHFSAFLTPENIVLLKKVAPLHDIVKIGIPDAILLKSGPLTAEERQIMDKHAEYGARALEQTTSSLLSTSPINFLTIAKEIAHWHHEKWDGSGYPDGLVGDAIPISAQLMALADVFDAIVSRRSYKPAQPFSVARDYIVAARGTQFNPDVVDAFLACYEDFILTAQQNPS